MPPSAKFTKEEIIAAAFDLVRIQGMDALTARALAAALGSSPRPIFTVFESVEQIRRSVRDRAQSLYRSYVVRGMQEVPPFKGVGMQYIRFAADEPVLFRLLFLTPQDQGGSLASIIPGLDENYDLILSSLTGFYGLPRTQAARIYEHLGIYAHGLATAVATGVSTYSEQDASARLTDVFKAILARVQSGGDSDNA